MKALLMTAVVIVSVAALMFHFFQRRLSSAAFALAAHPQVLSQLTDSLDDQKRLAELDPASAPDYRERFDALERTVHRLQILEHSREELIRRYDLIVLAIFAAIVVAVTVVHVVRQGRHEPRLARLQQALAELASGRSDIEVGDRRGDTIGRIAAMIEQTSQVMARHRQRLASLRNLSAWQEAARRQAHEMRTPLTGARLELTRLKSLVTGSDIEDRSDAIRAADGVMEELDRLGRFTQQFTSFARLPSPQLEKRDVSELVEEFVATYREAWQNLDLEVRATPDHCATIDPGMIRQVLVNLCDNSSQACGANGGKVRVTVGSGPSSVYVDVADDGPGVAHEVRPRLFEPYATTRSVGEGMGLGLAISRKIMLDHGGDLELVGTAEHGTTFRLVLPSPETAQRESTP